MIRSRGWILRLASSELSRFLSSSPLFVADRASTHSSSSISTGGQPKGLAATSSDLIFLATSSSLAVLQAGSKLATLPLSSPATAVAASSDGSIVVVATEDLKATVFDAKDPKDLKKVKEVELRSQATAATFSGDGKYLALGLSTGKVPL